MFVFWKIKFLHRFCIWEEVRVPFGKYFQRVFVWREGGSSYHILGLDKPNGLSHVYKKTLALTNRCLTDKPSLLDSLLQEVCQQVDPVE